MRRAVERFFPPAAATTGCIRPVREALPRACRSRAADAGLPSGASVALTGGCVVGVHIGLDACSSEGKCEFRGWGVSVGESTLRGVGWGVQERCGVGVRRARIGEAGVALALLVQRRACGHTHLNGLADGLGVKLCPSRCRCWQRSVSIPPFDRGMREQAHTSLPITANAAPFRHMYLIETSSDFRVDTVGT